ncbi:aminodeoxychorismate synthase component I [Galenea microaerophila]
MRHLSLDVSNAQQAETYQAVMLSSTNGSMIAEDLLRLHQAFPEKYPYLLESVATTADHRFSILFAYPQAQQTLRQFSDAAAFQQQFAEQFAQLQLPPSEQPTPYPFTGGWFVYLSYEYGQVVEPVLSLPESDLPLAILTRVPAAVILDHQQNQIVALVEKDFEALLPQIEQDWQQVQNQALLSEPLRLLSQSQEPAEKFLQGVARIKDYILAGDVFQVNLSRQWSMQLAAENDAVAVYQALRAHNPAPFAALAQFDNWAIISSSPERLVRTRWQSQGVQTQMQVETRPIAGTRKRATTAAEDQALREELIAHSKERAEHIMLIDLERNDLGRICQPGSVQVNELMTIESYQHVHHIVSNVQGHLKLDLNPLQVLNAVFPGGTITGCPKIRCMEIIAELEQMPRQAYTGSLGYINRDGSMDTNILIRSFIHRPPFDNQLMVRAGAGIVADSIAERELEETRHKARGLLRALGAVEHE